MASSTARTSASFVLAATHVRFVPRWTLKEMPTDKPDALPRAERRANSTRLLSTKTACAIVSGKPRVLFSVLTAKNACML
eukprot:1274530-Rhodomonas_salina.2